MNASTTRATSGWAMCAVLVAVIVVGCAGAPVPSQTSDPTLTEGVSAPATPSISAASHDLA
jgi:hypothetical protein